MGEEFIGGEFQFGEVACCGAQPAHGGGGVQSMADDIADEEGDAGAGEGDDVEPVATHSGFGGQVAVRDLDGVLLGMAAREQAALKCQS